MGYETTGNELKNCREATQLAMWLMNQKDVTAAHVRFEIAVRFCLHYEVSTVQSAMNKLWWRRECLHNRVIRNVIPSTKDLPWSCEVPTSRLYYSVRRAALQDALVLLGLVKYVNKSKPEPKTKSTTPDVADLCKDVIRLEEELKVLRGKLGKLL